MVALRILGKLVLALALAPLVQGQDLELDWALTTGSTGHDGAYAIAVDIGGNVYVTGDFSGTVDFDPGVGTTNLVSNGNGDIFVAKYDAAGALQWAHGFGSSDGESGSDIAIDGSGNVIVAGYFSDTVDFDPGVGTTSLTEVDLLDHFVLKLDSAGNFIWAIRTGGSHISPRIAIGSSDTILVTGTFNDTRDFDPGPGTYNLSSGHPANDDIYIMKLTSAAGLVWAGALSGTTTDIGEAIAVDSSDNVYVAGRFAISIDADPGGGTTTLTSSGSSDILLAKYTSAGVLSWARGVGGSGSDLPADVIVDSAGNVFMTGIFSDTVDFDPGTGTASRTSNGNHDAYVEKFDTTGAFQWVRTFGDSGIDQGRGIALDSSGNILTTGLFSGTVDFDSGVDTDSETAVGDRDIYLHTLDSSGGHLGVQVIGGSLEDAGNKLVVDGSDSVYLAAYFQDTVDIDPNSGTDNRVSGGLRDIAVLKLDPPVDVTPPQCVIIDPSTTGPTNATSLSFLLEFSEAVVNFNDEFDLDIVHSGSSHTSVTIGGGPGVYSVQVNGLAGEGAFTLAVSTSSDVEDAAGNGLSASVSSGTILVDTIAPAANLIEASTVSPTNEDDILFTVMFDEPVSNFDDGSDLVISHTGTAHAGVQISGGPLEYDVVLEGVTGDGAVTLEVNTASDVEDVAANPLIASTVSDPVLIDNTPPTISAFMVTPETVSAMDVLQITFMTSPDIAGPPDVIINGHPAAYVSGPSPGFTYTYTVSGSDPAGLATIEVTALDTAGNTTLFIADTTLTIEVSALPMPVHALFLALLLTMMWVRGGCAVFQPVPVIARRRRR